MSGSVRALVARNVTAVSACCAALVLLPLYFVQRSDLTVRFDEEVRADLRSIENVTNVYPDGDVYVNWNYDVLTEFSALGNKVFQVWQASDLATLDQSPLLEERRWNLLLPDLRVTGVSVYGQRLPDGRRVRIAAKRMIANWGWTDGTVVPDGFEEPTLVVAAGRDRTPLDAAQIQLAKQFVLTGVLLTLLSGVTAHYAAGHGLRTLSSLASELEQRRIERRDEPFSETAPSEVRLVARALNRLLERMNLAMARERRFLADTAHELNTPLAELRTVNDIALLRPDDTERLRKAVETSRHISARLGETLKALFTLSRGEHHHEPPQLIELRPLIDDLWDRAQARAGRRALQLVLDLGREELLASPTALHGVLSNLLNNAAAYAPNQSIVRISTPSSEKSVDVIAIENDTPQLEPQDLERMFEPFWRHHAQDSHDGRMGLGLALVQAYADDMGMTLHAALSEQRVLRFTLRRIE